MAGKIVELKIAGTTMDLPEEGIDVVLTYEVEPPNWSDICIGSRTETSIDLPNTQQNEVALQEFAQLNSTTKLVTRRAELLVDGIQLMRGFAVHQNIIGKMSGFGQFKALYKMTIVGQNANWGNLIKGLRLADLLWDDLNHFKTNAAVEAGLDAKYPAQEYGYCLIKYAALYQDKGLLGSTDFPDLMEFTPFLFKATIIKRIFEYIKVPLQSDFFNSNFYKTQIYPIFPIERLGGQFSVDFLDARAAIPAPVTTPLDVVTTFHQVFPTDVFSQPPNDPIPPFSGGVYTAHYRGYRTVSVKSLLKADSPAGIEIVLQIFVNGTFVPGILSGVYVVDGSLDDKEVTFSAVIPVEVGDVISFGYFTMPVLPTFPNTTLPVTIKTFEVTITGEWEQLFGQPGTFNYFKYLFRNVTVQEFLLAETQLFNLIFEPNGLGVVQCEPRDDYYLTDRIANTITPYSGFYRREANPNRANSWQYKVDFEQDVEIIPSKDAKNQLYVFKSDANDAYDQDSSKDEQLPRYACTVNINTQNTNENTKFENVLYAGTSHYFDQKVSAPNGFVENTVQVPLLLKKEGYEFQPRSLLFRATQDWQINDGYIKYCKDRNPAIVFTGKHAPAYAVNMNDTTGLDMNLSLCDYTINSNNLAGLVRRFRLSKISELVFSKKLVLYMYLSLQDVNSMSFRNKILFQGRFYKVVKVENYSPINNVPCKVTLMHEPNELLSGFGVFIPSPFQPNVF
jgi:hypothetical protein